MADGAIREGDTPALHVMLADAQLRQGRADLALEDSDTVRSRWPTHHSCSADLPSRRALQGASAKGCSALDDLVTTHGDELLELRAADPLRGFGNRQPIESVDQDRARMLRFADAYRTRGGRRWR